MRSSCASLGVIFVELHIVYSSKLSYRSCKPNEYIFLEVVCRVEIIFVDFHKTSDIFFRTDGALIRVALRKVGNKVYRFTLEL